MVNLVTFDDRPLLMEEYSRELCTAIPEVTTVVNTINTRKAQVAFGDIEKIYFGKGVIEEHLGRFRFSISAGSK